MFDFSISIRNLLLLLLFFAFHLIANSRRLDEPVWRHDEKGDEAWGYVNVKPGGYQFWWLFYASGTNSRSSESRIVEKPLIVWLQGGPGVPATGNGIFKEIGPYDKNFNERPTTWRKSAHLLFIDNPVGTGFSYAKSPNVIATNRQEVGEELLVTIKTFLEKFPSFQSTPLYIFAESYGPKFAVVIARLLFEARERGELKCDIRGVALGDGLISPIDNVKLWLPFLMTMGLIDYPDYDKLNDAFIKPSVAAYERGDFYESNRLRWQFRSTVTKEPYKIYIFNIMQPVGNYENVDCFQSQNPAKGGYFDLMNNVIRDKLQIIPPNVTWYGRSCVVNRAHGHEIMKPAVSDVEYLLTRTNLTVTVFNGQLDMNIPAEATLKWVTNLKWPGAEQWRTANRSKDGFVDQSQRILAWYKEHDQLSFYWVFNAGHMVPADAGFTAYRMMKRITGQQLEPISRAAEAPRYSLLFIFSIAGIVQQVVRFLQ